MARQWLQEASKIRNTDEKLFEIPFEKQTLHSDRGCRVERCAGVCDSFEQLYCRRHERQQGLEEYRQCLLMSGRQQAL